MLEEARKLAPAARLTSRFEDILDAGLDGIVIATPSAMHAEQALQALERKLAVFCQKPLGRNASEVQRIVAAARAADRLLAIDLSYRHTRPMVRLKQLFDRGAIGSVFAVELVFHNGYGPDKPWFFDPALSGGGCVMDLGVHLVDLGLWVLQFPEVRAVSSQLFHHGRPLADPSREVEDYAIAQLALSNGACVQLACSWNLPIGRDATIQASFFGSKGGLSFQNVQGSFYDFTLEQFTGTKRQLLEGPPDDWGGKAILAWVAKLATRKGFAPEADDLQRVASVLDSIYHAHRKDTVP
jgi:predicted dehydrogenase